MLDHVRRQPVAYLALFVALGGTSYAAATLPANSVGTAQIKNSAVTGAKLAGNAVTGAKLAANAVTGAKVAANAVTGAKVAAGSLAASDLAPGTLRGLTASAWGDDHAVTPPSTGGVFVIKQVTITMPQPGKLVVLDARVENGQIDNVLPTPLSYSTGVYVDGVGVPGTYSSSPGNVAQNSSLPFGPYSVGPGSIANISAGTHTVTLALRSADTSTNYVTSAQGRLLVAATG